MEELGVDVVLGERLSLPEDDKIGETKTVTTSTGKVIEYDLLVSPFSRRGVYQRRSELSV